MKPINKPIPTLAPVQGDAVAYLGGPIAYLGLYILFPPVGSLITKMFQIISEDIEAACNDIMFVNIWIRHVGTL